MPAAAGNQDRGRRRRRGRGQQQQATLLQPLRAAPLSSGAAAPRVCQASVTAASQVCPMCASAEALPGCRLPLARQARRICPSQIPRCLWDLRHLRLRQVSTSPRMAPGGAGGSRRGRRAGRRRPGHSRRGSPLVLGMPLVPERPGAAARWLATPAAPEVAMAAEGSRFGDLPLGVAAAVVRKPTAAHSRGPSLVAAVAAWRQIPRAGCGPQMCPEGSLALRAQAVATAMARRL